MEHQIKEITITSSSSKEMDKNINNLIQTIKGKYPDDEYNVYFSFQYTTPIVVRPAPLQFLFSTQIWIDIEEKEEESEDEES